MSPNRATDAYQTVGAYGAVYADPHHLISMLLDGALDRLARAKGAMQLDDSALKGELISAALTIISGLKGCLNMQQGDPLSNNLADLYDYICRRVLRASATNEPRYLDEVVGLLNEIRAAWGAIPQTVRAEHGHRPR